MMIGSSLAALTAILAISIELMGWRGGDLTVLDGVDVPEIISSFYMPEEFSSTNTAIEEHDYEAVKEQLMLTPMASSQEVLYVLAQVAVIGQHPQAPNTSASFLNARSNADDPMDVPEQRRYALEVAAHGQAVTVEGHAFLAKQLRNRTVATAALYGLCLIALFSVGTMLLGMNIRRRAVRLG